ncbi:MAG: hypothetical protein EOO40_07650, partial [Deltaproteobacteria bacterium]
MVTFKTAGSNMSLAVNDSGNALSASQSGITVNAGPLASFTVSGYPNPSVAGTGGTVSVASIDSYNNVATTYSGTIHFSSNDTQAVLPADTTLSSGTGSFSVTLKTAGASRSIRVNDTATTSATGSQLVTINPGSLATLRVTGLPGSVPAGLAETVTVAGADNYGNTASGYLGTVSFSSSDGSASLPATYTYVSGDAGSHSFSGLTFNTTGSQSITANDAGGLSGSQSTTVTAAASVAALFSGTNDWTYYIVNDGGLNSSGAACSTAGNYTSNYNQACLHKAEYNVLPVPGYSSCTGLTASDALGAFNWACDASTGTARMYSYSLKVGKGLLDLLNFSNNQWKPNSVTVASSGSNIYTSASSQWWGTSQIKTLSFSAATTLSTAGLYIINATSSTNLTFGANHIAVVVAPSVSVSLDAATGITYNSNPFCWV